MKKKCNWKTIYMCSVREFNFFMITQLAKGRASIWNQRLQNQVHWNRSYLLPKKPQSSLFVAWKGKSTVCVSVCVRVCACTRSFLLVIKADFRLVFLLLISLFTCSAPLAHPHRAALSVGLSHRNCWLCKWNTPSKQLRGERKQQRSKSRRELS